MTLLRFFCNATLLVMLYASGVFAQTKAPAPIEAKPAATSNLKTEKKQEINFEDELVEGTAQKPEFFYLFQKKNFNYKRLIRLRENFIPEMRTTAEDIQRLRGGR